LRTRLNHVGQVVRDLDRTVAFYQLLGAKMILEDKFIGDDTSRGLGLRSVDARFALLKLGDALIELIQYINPLTRNAGLGISDHGASHLAIEVDDIDAAVEELTGHGVTFEAPPVWIDSGLLAGNAWCYGYGPDGLVFELQQVGESIRSFLATRATAAES
jgi:catechol 2,3-dioxygenase-like lactoylglutathione lyase family enzyme